MAVEAEPPHRISNYRFDWALVYRIGQFEVFGACLEPCLNQESFVAERIP